MYSPYCDYMQVSTALKQFFKKFVEVYRLDKFAASRAILQQMDVLKIFKNDVDGSVEVSLEKQKSLANNQIQDLSTLISKYGHITKDS